MAERSKKWANRLLKRISSGTQRQSGSVDITATSNASHSSSKRKSTRPTTFLNRISFSLKEQSSRSISPSPRNLMPETSTFTKDGTSGLGVRHGQDEDKDELPVLKPRLCAVCQCIDASIFSPSGYRHYKRRDDLLEAARSGCRICIWLRDTLVPDWDIPLGLPGTRAPKPVGIEDWMMLNGDLMDSNDLDHQRHLYPLVLRYQDSRLSLVKSVYAPTAVTSLTLYADEDSEIGGKIPLRRLQRHVTLGKVIECFASLLMNTTSTLPKSQSHLPTRALCVDKLSQHSPDTIALVDFGDHPPKEHYICLSHRWSHSKPLTTTADTIGIRKAGIDITQLSPTIRDAIYLTRRLGIHYLWIDSLCILQDSQVDWEVESAKMGSYYGNSWLTIAAALDGQMSEGLFGSRSAVGHETKYYRLDLSSPHGKSDYVYFTGQDETRIDNRSISLLFTRGWTLQEEALSSRFLSFQPHQMSLRIGDMVYHESGVSQHVNDTTYLNASESAHMSWTQIVEDYSRRYLTQEADKLPALSGMAHRYIEIEDSQRALVKNLYPVLEQNQAEQFTEPDVYLAGLWLNSFPDQLCWSVVHSSSSDSARRPAHYRAPSWSWASLNGSIAFDRNPGLPKVRRCDIVNAMTVPTGKDPLGQVSQGFLLLQAKLCQQLWRFKTGYSSKWYFAHPVGEDVPPDLLSSNMPYSNASLVLDVPEDTSIKELKVWSLPLKDQFALALQDVPGKKGIFKRIGAITWRGERDDKFQQDMTKITII